MTDLLRSADMPTEADVARARAAAISRLTHHRIAGELCDDVVLVVSELVTNAIRHARSGFILNLEIVVGDAIRVSVFDLDSRQPVLVGSDDDATSGRGLQIIAGLAADWGSNPEERDGIHGKVVWAELT